MLFIGAMGILQVLVRRNGRIRLYCKGADSTVYPCLHSSCITLSHQTAEHMNVSLVSVSPFGSICFLLCNVFQSLL